MRCQGSMLIRRATAPDLGWVSPELQAFAVHNGLGAGRRQVAYNVRTVQAFLRACGVAALQAIDQAMVECYLSGLHISPKTLRNQVGALSLFCEWLVKGHVLPANPARGLRLPRLPKRLPHWLNEPELREALQIARRYGIYAEVCLAVNTGLRRGELRLMRWDWIDFPARMLTVPPMKSKDERKVPLNSVAIDALKALQGNGSDYVFPGWRSRRAGPRNGPRDPGWWEKALKPIADALPTYRKIPKGVTGRGWHTLRHTFGTRFMLKGGKLNRLKGFMGHQSIATTDIYVHTAEEWDPDIERISCIEGEDPCVRG